MKRVERKVNFDDMEDLEFDEMVDILEELDEEETEEDFGFLFLNYTDNCIDDYND